MKIRVTIDIQRDGSRLRFGSALKALLLNERSTDATHLRNPLVIYHAHCPDGVAAAWVCRQRWPDCDLIDGKYHDPPDLARCVGRDVLMVDFSFKRPVLEQVAAAAKSVTILDHHTSSQAELDGFTGAFFDMNRSGCGMAWDVLFPGEAMPLALRYIQDRDLWQFSLLGTRDFAAWLASEELTIETISKAAGDGFSDAQVGILCQLGAVVLRYQARLVAEAVKCCGRTLIDGHDVPCMPMPIPQLISDVGHQLCRGEPFSATWRDVDGKRVYSLRSDDEGVDVSEIARRLGGGGHKHAAGFTVIYTGQQDIS
jgi:hypothetical protein